VNCPNHLGPFACALKLGFWKPYPYPYGRIKGIPDYSCRVNVVVIGMSRLCASDRRTLCERRGRSSPIHRAGVAPIAFGAQGLSRTQLRQGRPVEQQIRS
jgi:hypothetical protein